MLFLSKVRHNSSICNALPAQQSEKLDSVESHSGSIYNDIIWSHQTKTLNKSPFQEGVVVLKESLVAILLQRGYNDPCIKEYLLCTSQTTIMPLQREKTGPLKNHPENLFIQGKMFMKSTLIIQLNDYEVELDCFS